MLCCEPSRPDPAFACLTQQLPNGNPNHDRGDLMKRLNLLAAIILIIACGSLAAQQSQDFGQYVVHYNVINSNLIPAQVAQGYGIKRSASRALVNITVMDMSVGQPVQAQITTQAINLTGQRRDVDMREISDPEGGLYYIGEMPIHNMENYNFKINIKLEGEPKPFELEFRQQLYTQ